MQPDRHQEGEFAALFARRARTPLRGFLPGRRVWTAVGGTAVAVAVIAGTGAFVTAIDWGGGADDVSTLAVGKDTKAAPGPTGTGRKKRGGTSSPGASPGSKDASPDVVYAPGAGTGPAANSGQGSTSQTTSSGGGTGTSTGNNTGTTSSVSTSTPATTKAATPYLWADGNVDTDSNDYWDQSSITVRTTTALTALKVVVRIAQTGSVASTGSWSSLGDKVSVSAAADSSQLAYVVTLKSGVTIGAGTYVFQFQYNHSQGQRDAGGDRYNVTATSTGSSTEFIKGGFA